MDKNPPANAGTQVRSLLWEDPQALGQLRQYATTTEAHAQQKEKPLQWKAQALQLESNPHLSQLEKALMKQWRPSATKNK